MTLAVYPGSFDPITYGHIDILQRAARIFDRVIIAASRDGRKVLTFSLEERMELLRLSTGEFGNVEIDSFGGLLVDFVKRRKASVIIRGLREVSDFEYEYQMAVMNSKLAPDVETVFLSTGSEYYFVSSSLIKEVARLGGDVSGLVPPPVLDALGRKLGNAAKGGLSAGHGEYDK